MSCFHSLPQSACNQLHLVSLHHLCHAPHIFLISVCSLLVYSSLLLCFRQLFLPNQPVSWSSLFVSAPCYHPPPACLQVFVNLLNLFIFTNLLLPVCIWVHSQSRS
ncbi:hypothetical protein ATANTOWER_019448 [Ataeniobius toweri]|uniref:Uncharacterized protein n=1 Tax=Ataeniobius toweri TaxID=208326 RepID=A0ABU7A8P0_9TELE|nr:hypothetical protein [Ataeniobius toweri]